ncbi:MAG: AmmeMemoRadiSam system protein A [Blastocatellia bacterium AA13]|nr:MAG: AmmeMemoRadiSam system protein A [Blastocatellia bacterium AA13]
MSVDFPPDNISPTDLARISVESFVRDHVVIEPPRNPQGILAGRAGAFVTLRMRDGDLRGCIGTILPLKPTVAAEIIENAIGAACRDHRFSRVLPEELVDIVYGVDVLSAPEPVSGPEELDPLRFGIIISSVDGFRRGVLLPGISGIQTVEQQWQAVHSKAGISIGEKVLIQRFTVTRFGKD